VRAIVRSLIAFAAVAVLAVCTAGAQYPATSSTALTSPELKYRLLDQFGSVVVCGPPVVRNGDAVKNDAIAAFPAIQNDRELFGAIARRLQLAGVTDPSADQKLLVYIEYQRLKAITLEPAGDRQRFSIQVGTTDPRQVTLIEGTIDRFGAIQVTRQEPRTLNCPICLAEGTRIATPDGEIAVEDLRAGMLVWTLDDAGRRVALPIERTVRTPVPRGHRVTRLVLEDGRLLIASPGHPARDGRPIGELAIGDTLDGSRVVDRELLVYAQPATFDILPSGPTGTYWANGVALRSTLPATR
jgi:hypothetical protein